MSRDESGPAFSKAIADTIEAIKRKDPPRIPIQPVRPEPLEKCDRPGCELGCRCGLGLLAVLGLLLVVGLVALFLSGCPSPQEPVAPTPSPRYPPDYYQLDESEEALESSTPNDTQFPFDPEGTNCPPNEE